jgi:hypothetical protein
MLKDTSAMHLIKLLWNNIMSSNVFALLHVTNLIFGLQEDFEHLVVGRGFHRLLRHAGRHPVQPRRGLSAAAHPQRRLLDGSITNRRTKTHRRLSDHDRAGFPVPKVEYEFRSGPLEIDPVLGPQHGRRPQHRQHEDRQLVPSPLSLVNEG